MAVEIEERERRRLRRQLRLWRTASVVLAALLLIVGGGAILEKVRSRPVPAAVIDGEEIEIPPRLDLVESSFRELPGWLDDDVAESLPALAATCRRIATWPPERELGRNGLGGTAGDWAAGCEGIEELSPGDTPAARELIESEFSVWQLSNRGVTTGLFTGYYEPTLRGRRRRAPGFETPLYLRPPELVEVDLGEFRDDLEGRRIAGRMTGRNGSGRLEPYDDRAAIRAGALDGRGLALVWVDDPVDAFFLHIQGSGRVELEGGGFLRVGYAAQNGHSYFPIGRDLVSRGALSLEEVSMQSIRRWLDENPAEAAEVMALNASYVFFRELAESGPVGSLGVVLTPERSIAVDRKFLPLGAPFWVETTLPELSSVGTGSALVAGSGSLATGGAGAAGTSEDPETAEDDAARNPTGPAHPPASFLRRLMVAQDTGGAISGPVRADLFWGPGERAAEIAGRMRQEGRMWLLLPRGLDEATREWVRGDGSEK